MIIGIKSTRNGSFRLMTTESSYTNRITIIHRSLDKNLAVHKVTHAPRRAQGELEGKS